MAGPSEANSTAQGDHAHSHTDQPFYRVYKLEIDSVAYDPFDPNKRYHDSIWVEHDPEKRTGKLFNVTGDVLAASGMYYEEKTDWNTDRVPQLHALNFLGRVLKSDFDPGKVAEILRAYPTAHATMYQLLAEGSSDRTARSHLDEGEW